MTEKKEKIEIVEAAVKAAVKGELSADAATAIIAGIFYPAEITESSIRWARESIAWYEAQQITEP